MDYYANCFTVFEGAGGCIPIRRNVCLRQLDDKEAFGFQVSPWGQGQGQTT